MLSVGGFVIGSHGNPGGHSTNIFRLGKEGNK
jgi:hypothetical protein